MSSTCRLCETRKPRRHCPGIGGEICPRCCGTEREVGVNCPLDCEYLLEGRRHEKPREVNPDEFPNRDIEISERFLRENEPLLVFLARSLLEAALEASGSVDADVADALAAMIRSYRTLESGLIYQTRPANPYAAAIQQRLDEAIARYREGEVKATGVRTIRDAQVLGLLAFLERMQFQHNNGRRRGRAFLSFLREFFARPGEQPMLAV